MPYKTIQQNFANGELNPKMQGRADVDMYYKSAQKMRDVVTTPYGGFVRRPGSKMIYRGGNALTSLSGMNTDSDLTASVEHPLANAADLNLSTYAVVTSDNEDVEAGSNLISVADALTPSTTTETYYAWRGYRTKMYAWKMPEDPDVIFYTSEEEPRDPNTIPYMKVGDHEFTPALRNEGAGPGYCRCIYMPRTGTLSVEGWYGNVAGDGYIRDAYKDGEQDPFYVYTKDENPSISDNIYEDTDGTLFSVIESIDATQITDANRTYTRDEDFDETKTIVTPGTPKVIKRVTVRRVSSTASQQLKLMGETADSNKVLKEFVSGPEEHSFYVDTNDVFTRVYITNAEEQPIDLTVYEIELYYQNDVSGSVAVRMVPFVFNNEQAYLVSFSYKNIKIFREGTLLASIAANDFTNDVIANMRYTQSADTLIIVHPDMHPKQLVRGANESTWTLSNFAIESMPLYNYDPVAATAGNTTATPNELDGTVTITLENDITGVDFVGQYFEGNGGRVRITSKNGKKLTGYTVIGLYSTDPITDWTYTTDYENVWSDERGWPSSVTFHGGRLWFGGSKSRPQTVWGSKVGMYHRFDSTSGYDNDAIEFTLDTSELNKITDIYSQKNLMIFTLGGEFVCASSFNEPLTPNNINAVKQTSNGSWDKTSPVDIEGTVMFVERKGQGLMAFAASDNTTDIYNSANSSLINSHLIKSPVDLDAERNNLTQQTNYIYLVNKDGTLCVVNLLRAEGITGGYTLWKTEGEYKGVCVLPDETYVLVARPELSGNILYIERLDYNALSDGEETRDVNGTTVNIPRFALRTIDVFSEGEFVGQYTADENGTITFPVSRNGQLTFGFAFRWEVESNFLEIPQLGVGMSRKKRLATMMVRTLDTKELTVNGETQPGGEGIVDIEYYGIGDWDFKPTWIMKERVPCKVNVMAVQMNVNYQVSTDEY
jgi:hypothetical protein